MNIEGKERSNLFPWNGQFSPQLVEALLTTFARPEQFVLDPFLGSGTVLFEAGRRGHPAFGSELNPAAFKMAEVYRFINVEPAKRRWAAEKAEELIEGALPMAPSLFAPRARAAAAPIKEALAEQAGTAPDLCRLLIEALIVLLDYGEGEPTCDVVLSTWGRLGEGEPTCDVVLSTWGRLRETVLRLPQSDQPIELANCDARSLPLPIGRADVVITSPPYINVFNYHQQYRRSVETLRWDLLEVARSEIGSNRKHRGNRFLTVIQYCLDMAAMFTELRRVCRPAARVIVVVGRESNVRKTRFFNGEIVARLAVQTAGYQLEMRQERVFQNRFGEMIYEDILHLAPGAHASDQPVSPRDIARETLTAAKRRAPQESQADLSDALERLEGVGPSPLYCQEAARAGGEGRKRREVV